MDSRNADQNRQGMESHDPRKNRAMAEGTTMIRRVLGPAKMRRTISRLLKRGVNFNDARGRRVVLLPHCALNQNSRVAGAAVRPAAMEDLIAGLLQHNIGIVQMPCPELILLGLDRAHLPISAELEKAESQAQLRRLALDLIDQITAYRRCGVAVLAILGKNGSPTCGVEKTWRRGVVPGTGVFIEVMRAQLQNHGLKVKILGIEDDNPDAVLSKLEGL
jgi:predicted secreted protein